MRFGVMETIIHDFSAKVYHLKKISCIEVSLYEIYGTCVFSVSCYNGSSVTLRGKEGKTMKKHNGFSGSLGFVLAAAGSAVGVGNI